MSSELPADVGSPAPEELAALTRERGAPLLEALERHSPGAREHAEATASYAFVVAGRGRDRGPVRGGLPAGARGGRARAGLRLAAAGP